MARLNRLEVPGWPHLLAQYTQPGEPLVRDDHDRHVLWMAMLDSARETKVAVHAYAVLDDRFYMLATPAAAKSLGLFMQGIGRRYVARYNHRHGRVGNLWHGRFRGTVLSPEGHVLQAMVMLEQLDAPGSAANVDIPGLPQSAPLVSSPLSSPGVGYSSRAHHLQQRTDALVQDHAMFWALGNTPFERESAWRRWLDQGLNPQDQSRLQSAMDKGWALLDASELLALETVTGRRLSQKKRGRPRKIEGVKAV